MTALPRCGSSSAARDDLQQRHRADPLLPRPGQPPHRAVPHNHGVASNNNSSGGGFAGWTRPTPWPVAPDAGYRTGHVGKYMNGYGKGSTIPVGWDEWWATSKNPFLMYDYTLHNGGETPFGFTASDYKTDVITGSAATSSGPRHRGRSRSTSRSGTHPMSSWGPTAGLGHQAPARPRHLNAYSTRPCRRTRATPRRM